VLIVSEPSPLNVDNKVQRDITELLQVTALQDRDNVEQLYQQVYPVLRKIATSQLDTKRVNLTQQATEIVHEAYEKISEQHAPWQNRQHFYAVSTRLIRRIIVDHIRSKYAVKRGGDRLVMTQINDELHGTEPKIDWLTLDQALNELAKLDPQAAMLVEWRYFGGLSIKELADLLGISVSSVKRKWLFSKACLTRFLEP